MKEMPKTRKEYGFTEDKFTGHIYLLDDKPYLQLHLYDDYFTLFWLGKVNVKELNYSLDQLTHELSEEQQLPLQRFNRGTARYGLDQEVVYIDFVINPETDEGKKIYEEHSQFINLNENLIKFARYDVKSDIPIILWADLIDSQEAEIGFSSTKVIPRTILNLMGKTSFSAMNGDQLKDLGEDLLSKVNQ